MNRIGNLYKIWSLVALLSLAACGKDENNDDNNDFDINGTPKMELTVSGTEIELNPDEPGREVLKIEWTRARQLPEDYTLTYLTELDLEENNFSNPVRTEENNEVFSKTFTTSYLQGLIANKWGKSLTETVTLQFRITASWEGPEFAMPEVKTVSVVARPYKPLVFDADKMYIDGSAVPGSRIEISKTLENEYQYAWLGNLETGELHIPVEYQGSTNYICPADGNGTLPDGKAKAVEMKSAMASWTLTQTGEYRIVVDIEHKTVTIYPPDKKLEPYIATWETKHNPPVVMNTEVTELWMFGDGTGWGWWKGEFKQSLADPQILVYTGAAGALKNGNGVKFVVTGDESLRNIAWAFTNPLTEDGKRQSLSLAAGVVGQLWGEYDTETRNSYYKLPAGANFIVLDLRNMTIRAEIK